MRLLIAFGAVLSSVLALALPAAHAEVKLASACAADNFQTQNLQQFADDVNRATGTLRASWSRIR